MTRTEIIIKLANRGYHAEECEVIKNGVALEGIRIITDTNLSPIIYTEKLFMQAEEEGRTPDDVASTIINTYENNKTIPFNVELLKNRDYILNHIYIGLQKISTEDIIKKSMSELEGIEKYLVLREEKDSGDNYSIKVSEILLDEANVSSEEAWERALENTNAETIVESLAKVMAKMTGFECEEELEGETPFFILSNKSHVKGAASILNKKVLSAFARRYHTDKLVVLPSSIHEMLLLPYTKDLSLDEFSSMVKEVNRTEVDPTEQLADRAYIISV